MTIQGVTGLNWRPAKVHRPPQAFAACTNRADKRREFDSILLITPNEGLSEQHLKELRLSGIDAVLLVEDRSGQQTFERRVRVIKISKLLRQRRYDTDGEAPLPRLHIDKSLSNPLLLNPADFNLEDVSVSPPGLGRNEREFVKDLRAFWMAHQAEEPYRRYEVYLLRNMPKVGVGFFVHSGFYPDFILWARDRSRKTTFIRLLDPHGLHHAGLSGNANRFDALRRQAGLPDDGAGGQYQRGGGGAADRGRPAGFGR